jgi:DNA-binding transcriptional LysR family regulator
MDLRQLRYFLAVVDHGTFTSAAAAVHVSQPSVSQAVGALEAELGVLLFDRVGRNVRLTAAGRAMVDPARRAVRDVDTVAAAVAAVRGLAGGTLDLVALPTLAGDPTARLVGQFRQRHPAIRVSLAEPDTSAGLAAMVADGRCEVGLTELPLAPASGDDLVAVPLFHQEFMAVFPPATKAGSRGRIALADMAGLPMIAAPPGTSTRTLLDRALASTGVEPNVVVETAQREAILALVLEGAGGALLPKPLAQSAGAQGAVVLRTEPAVGRTVGFVRRDAPLSPAGAAFVQMLGEEARPRARPPRPRQAVPRRARP